jgi:hypothetical protein
MRAGRFALAVVIALAAGCRSFRSSKELDVGPFAENTVEMIGEVQRATKPLVWTHLKQYESLPSVQSVRDGYAPARTLMRGVALYSTQIVSIYDSELSDTQKSEELARYLDEAVRERLRNERQASLFLGPATLDSAVVKVRAAPTFMGALMAAQPVVSAALGFGNAVYDSVELKIDRAAADIDRRIEAEFAPLKRQQADVSELELWAMARYSWLSRYRLGDAAALDSLRAHDPEAAAAMPQGKRPTPAAIESTEKRLLDQLAEVGTLRGQLDKRLEEYRAQQKELDSIRVQGREATRLGRITLIEWARSHRNLASGIRVPAAIDLLGMMQGAASTVVP